MAIAIANNQLHMVPDHNTFLTSFPNGPDSFPTIKYMLRQKIQQLWYVPIQRVPSRDVRWYECSRKGAQPLGECPRFERCLLPAFCAWEYPWGTVGVAIRNIEMVHKSTQT